MSAAARSLVSGASRRWMHTSRVARAVTNMQMPAMSPTMKEGGIASWKVKEGEKYSAGDVLLEIETDKATIDVEAQEDGVLGKIILGDGAKSVPVGKVIALLAEEGDDISNLEVPKEEESAPAPKAEESAPAPAASSSSASSSSSAAPAPTPLAHGEHPTHSRTLFPSVLRLLQEHGIADATKIKGTGVRGMLTKGDVLAHLGLASGPTGTYKEPKGKADGPVPVAGGAKKEAPPKPLDAKTIRMAIVASMLEASKPKVPLPSATSFDDILADYLPPAPAAKSATIPPPPTPKAASADYFAGLF